MPTFSFSNPLTGRKVTSSTNSDSYRQGNGGKGHKSKLSTSPAITVSSHPSSSRLDRSGAGIERQSSNATSLPRPSMSASSSTQDVRLASFNNIGQSANAAAIGRKNIAGLTGEQKIVTVLINRLVSKASSQPLKVLFHRLQIVCGRSFQRAQDRVLEPRKQIRLCSKRSPLWRQYLKPSLGW